MSDDIRNQRRIAYWLLICCALVFAMVVLGGVTRLTGSGLSMVEWQPVYGILPPLSEAADSAASKRAWSGASRSRLPSSSCAPWTSPRVHRFSA